MGVRPPANDGDEPEVVEFGIAALDAKLDEVDVAFPTDARSLTNAAGHIEIPFDAAGHSMTLETALEAADRDRFEHEQELLNALHPVFEARREAAGNSLLSQLRALVPF